MSEYYKGKTVWITGASSGIGAAMALELSKKGAKLILSARRKQALQNIKEKSANPDKVLVQVMDMQDMDKFETIFNSVLKKVGKIDILINNAGVSQRSLATDTSFTTEKIIMDVNYFSVIKLSKLCLAHFLANKTGQFVIISSTTGKVGIPLRSSYAASKHALHGYFESMRAELGNDNIAITIICPASIQTDISKNALLGDGRQNAAMDDAQKNGMTVSMFTAKALKAIAKKKTEVAIGTFRESTLVLFLWRFFPNLFRKLIRKAKVT